MRGYRTPVVEGGAPLLEVHCVLPGCEGTLCTTLGVPEGWLGRGRSAPPGRIAPVSHSRERGTVSLSPRKEPRAWGRYCTSSGIRRPCPSVGPTQRGTAAPSSAVVSCAGAFGSGMSGARCPAPDGALLLLPEHVTGHCCPVWYRTGHCCPVRRLAKHGQHCTSLYRPLVFT